MIETFQVQSGSDIFQCQVVRSADDGPASIRVGYKTFALETLVIAYPAGGVSTTLSNFRPDDLDLTARKLAGRLAVRMGKPVMLSLEMPSQQDVAPELWASLLLNIERALLAHLVK